MHTRRSFLRGAGTGSALAALAAVRDRVALARPASPGRRSDYTLDPAITYLNHGAVGTVPRPVQEAHAEYLRICETNPSLYALGGDWEPLRERVRAEIAAFLGCEGGELALTHNTTEGFHQLAWGLPLGEGDEVVFSSLNHIGASACFTHVGAARGYAVRRFDMPAEQAAGMGEEEIVARYATAVGPRTRLLVLPHLDNLVGVRHPVAKLAAMAREQGVDWVAIDGAQTVGMIPVDVRALGVDFYCGSPHKWLQAPKGLGVFYVRAAARESLRPTWVTWGQQRWRGSVRTFEDYGTRDLAQVLTLGDAVAYHARTPWPQRIAHCRALRDAAFERVRNSSTVRWASPETFDAGGSLFTVRVDGVDPKALDARLAERAIVVRTFHHPGHSLVRISPNLINSADEVAQALEAIAG